MSIKLHVNILFQFHSQKILIKTSDKKKNFPNECPYNHDKEEKFKFLEISQKKRNEEREQERDQANKNTDKTDKKEKEDKKDKSKKKKDKKGEKEKEESSGKKQDFQQLGPMLNQPGNMGLG